jgi:ATP-grasp domain
VANPIDLGADAPPATIGPQFALLDPQARPTLLWLRWSQLAPMTFRQHLPRCPKRPTTSRTCRSLRLLLVAIRHSHLARENLPVYELPEDAVRSLGHACRYARWRREPTGRKPVIPEIDRQAARRIVAAALADRACWQPVAVTHALMDSYGIPLLETRLATSIESAEEMARELGFPVVMKATRPGLVTRASLVASSSDSRVCRPYARRTRPSHTHLMRRSLRFPCNRWCRLAWS